MHQLLVSLKSMQLLEHRKRFSRAWQPHVQITSIGLRTVLEVKVVISAM
jgi:hypothetical protein